MVKVDKDVIRDAYEEVRDDNSTTNWVVFGYTEDTITVVNKGDDFADMKAIFTDDERFFAFVRVFTGDELSKRAKFALVTWCGNAVGALKRARTSADKSLIKDVVQSYAADLMFSEQNEVSYDAIKEVLVKAGGANYGSG